MSANSEYHRASPDHVRACLDEARQLLRRPKPSLRHTLASEMSSRHRR
jgi:hypothetical protein